MNDVANTKMENVLEEIEQIIENEDLTKFLQIIEERVNESDYTAMDLAAAFLKKPEWFVYLLILVRKTKQNREISWAQLPVKAEFREN